MLGRQLFLPLCQSDRLVFLQHIKAKKLIFSTYRLDQIIFVSQKRQQIIVSKSLPALPGNEMVAP